MAGVVPDCRAGMLGRGAAVHTDRECQELVREMAKMGAGTKQLAGTYRLKL